MLETLSCVSERGSRSSACGVLDAHGRRPSPLTRRWPLGRRPLGELGLPGDAAHSFQFGPHSQPCLCSGNEGSEALLGLQIRRGLLSARGLLVGFSIMAVVTDTGSHPGRPGCRGWSSLDGFGCPRPAPDQHAKVTGLHVKRHWGSRTVHVIQPCICTPADF